MTNSKSRRLLLNTSALVGTIALSAIVAGTAAAQDRNYNIPSESLSSALRDYGHVSGRQLIFTEDLVRGRTAPALEGSYSADGALARLLEGTRLTTQLSPSGAIMIVRISSPQGIPAEESSPGTPSNVGEVVVTGTHIRRAGVQVSSDLVSVNQDQMHAQGEATVTDFVEDLPQNFNGGNPGVGLGAGNSNINNQNINGAVNFNLRGLGPDATLTLLNGRRLAYDSEFQSIDISTIPVAAISRIDVLLDGSSAIYGSDAVAGVANIILKPDYQGLDFTVRYGGATDGGDIQHEYSLVGGSRWDSGGFLIAGDIQQNSGVTNNQRDYTKYMPDHNSLYPSIDQQSVLFTGHQNLSPIAEITLDAIYSDRTNFQSTNYGGYYGTASNRTQSYAVSPTLKLKLPGDWNLEINGSYASDQTHVNEPVYMLDGTEFDQNVGCFCNTSQSVELDAEGPLFSLPAGQVRASVGAGYRSNTFDAISTDVPSATTTVTKGSQSSYFGYGEFDAPLISPSQGVPGVYRLSLNGALRYEDYDQFGSVATPKVGIIWALTDSFDLKGNWGQSFKAPTLLQEYTPVDAFLFPAAELGATSAPANATALLIYGGNSKLRPERATTFNVTAGWHPQGIPGLQLELAYFHIDYRDRIEQAVPNEFSVLSNPAPYAQYVTENPTAAQQAAAIGLATPPVLMNFTGAAYDPSAVVATISDQYQNLERQEFDGIDLSATYRIDLAAGRLTTVADATWLEGNQRATSTSPALQTVGTIYNPPHFRARGSATWTRGSVTISSVVSYIGGETNNTLVPSQSVGSQTTWDMIGGYAFKDPIGRFSVQLVAKNLLDTRPPYVTPVPNYYPNYDSTNYSAVGRYLGISLEQKW